MYSWISYLYCFLEQYGIKLWKMVWYEFQVYMNFFLYWFFKHVTNDILNFKFIFWALFQYINLHFRIRIVVVFSYQGTINLIKIVCKELWKLFLFFLSFQKWKKKISLMLKFVYLALIIDMKINFAILFVDFFLF